MEPGVRIRYLLAITLLLSVVAVAVNWGRVRAVVTGEPVEAAGIGSTSRTTGSRSFLDQFDIDNLRVPPDEILGGGPAKDGIPALTDPDATTARRADFLDPEDRVVGVVIEGEARAYPIRLLNWHEIINDQLGDIPIAVVYCPLCDSVSVFDRRMADKTLEFGVSGLLHNSNVLLYDRRNDALWSQVGFEAISGRYAGQSLRHLPFEFTTFERWSARHPDSTVANFETRHPRSYDRNPYGSYFASDELMFPATGAGDRRLRRKEPVVGVQLGKMERAYPVRAIADAPGGPIEEQVGDGRIVIEVLDGGHDVRVIEVPEGALVAHTFWFAWVSFHPTTTVLNWKSQ